jgi:hypothetical protein
MAALRRGSGFDGPHSSKLLKSVSHKHDLQYDNVQQTQYKAMIFKVPPQFEQCSMSKTRLSSLAQLMRAGAPCA